MATPNSLPIPNTPFLTPGTNMVTPEWRRFLFSLNRNSSEAVAGEVATPAGSGLEGGGFVADGVDLSIAPDGVTNAMLRPSIACSVIGQYANTSGNPTDIQANTNHKVLSREDDQLAFRNTLDGISIGPTTAAPLVRCDAFQIDQSPTAETVTCTHTITISVDGTDYKIPIVAA